MASSIHDTLSTDTVYSAQLDKAYARVLVTFRSTTTTAGNEIYFTTDGSTPTVKGAGTWVVAAVEGATAVATCPTSHIDSNGLVTPLPIKLITSGSSIQFSVEGCG